MGSVRSCCCDLISVSARLISGQSFDRPLNVTGWLAAVKRYLVYLKSWTLACHHGCRKGYAYAYLYC